MNLIKLLRKERFIPTILYWEDKLFESIVSKSRLNTNQIRRCGGFVQFGTNHIIIRKNKSKFRKIVLIRHECIHYYINTIFNWNTPISDFINYTWEIMDLIVMELLNYFIRISKRCDEYTKYYYEIK